MTKPEFSLTQLAEMAAAGSDNPPELSDQDLLMATLQHPDLMNAGAILPYKSLRGSEFPCVANAIELRDGLQARLSLEEDGDVRYSHDFGRVIVRAAFLDATVDDHTSLYVVEKSHTLRVRTAQQPFEEIAHTILEEHFIQQGHAKDPERMVYSPKMVVGGCRVDLDDNVALSAKPSGVPRQYGRSDALWVDTRFTCTGDIEVEDKGPGIHSVKDGVISRPTRKRYGLIPLHVSEEVSLVQEELVRADPDLAFKVTLGFIQQVRDLGKANEDSVHYFGFAMSQEELIRRVQQTPDEAWTAVKNEDFIRSTGWLMADHLKQGIASELTPQSLLDEVAPQEAGQLIRYPEGTSVSVAVGVRSIVARLCEEFAPPVSR